MMQTIPSKPLFGSVLLVGLLTLAPALPAQVVVTNGPVVGSSNPITADPPVTRPRTTPCTVQLFTNEQFADFSIHDFPYAPPANCPGPWSKVVFSADFTVTAGRQFDRTAMFLIGNMNIFYGTTSEPRATLSPSWHVESDVTDLSAGLKAAQTGHTILGNVVNSTFNGVIFANAQLQFYPADIRDPAPQVADIVVPLPTASIGAFTLNTTADQLSQSVTLPRNTEQAYLDVFAQSQINDEFWWTCVPSDVANELQSCGNTSFRETEISIDGKPAGIAPVYPWIYTGGVDPFLWEPIPGVQTLNFKPFRVNLTPFAGVLADGSPHTVALSVFNANSFFLATANLLVFTDPHAQRVTGGLLSDTLSAAPTPVVSENLNTATAGSIAGTVGISSARNYTISGFTTGSHGRVTTTVNANANFSNNQNFNINSTAFKQDITQLTTMNVSTTTSQGAVSTVDTKNFTYPLHFLIDQEVASDGSISELNTSDQRFDVTEDTFLGPLRLFHSAVANEVSSNDTELFTSAGAFIGPSNTSSTQTYKANDTLGTCFGRTLESAANKLTSVQNVSCF
ncbi:MAG TPA: peptide-N4-asparagine amidase [Acidobacteriaceae bacterium]|nr:peptide-N4-asparagine amidase [Acidobacteriaceae bacterium]